MEEEIIDSSFFSEDLEEKSSIDVKKTGLENSFNERQIGSITMTIEPVSSRASIDTVLDMFEQQPDLTAVPVERNDWVIGVIERDVIEKNKSSGFKLFASIEAFAFCFAAYWDILRVSWICFIGTPASSESLMCSRLRY